MATTQEKAAHDSTRARQGRSPAYPGIPLQKALEQARALYDAEGKYPVPLASAFKAWGFGVKSSGGRETKAALRYFGLIVAEGEGGKIKISDKALRVLLDDREDQTEKKALIRELALTPVIHAEIAAKFSDGIKSDGTVEHFLVFEKGFNKSAAGELVAEFKATADYAGLFKPDKLVVKEAEKPGENDVLKHAPLVGDIVQWAPAGVRQFSPPRRVRALSADGEWVFVEESETGLPIDEIEVIAAGESESKDKRKPPILPLDLTSTGVRREVFTLDEGDVVLTFPDNLSAMSFEDLDAYLKVFITKMRRRAGVLQKADKRTK